MQLIGLTLFVAGLGTAAAIYWFKQDLAAAIVVAMLGTFLGARFAGLIGGG